MWKELCGRLEEEVLDMFNVEATKQADKGRGEPLKWQMA